MDSGDNLTTIDDVCYEVEAVSHFMSLSETVIFICSEIYLLGSPFLDYLLGSLSEAHYLWFLCLSLYLQYNRDHRHETIKNRLFTTYLREIRGMLRKVIKDARLLRDPRACG
jgi:hypothetical protein